MHPLADDYPDFSPYHYAADDPITNVDEDGLDPISSLAQLACPGVKAALLTTFDLVHIGVTAAMNIGRIAVVQEVRGLTTTSVQVGNLTAITLRGSSDAYKSATTLGILGRNNLSSYKTPEEKAAYLRGRLIGDAAAAAQGSGEVPTGGGMALTTGLETLGWGVVAGAAVSAHGYTTELLATKDAAICMKELYELSATGSTPEIKPYKELKKEPQLVEVFAFAVRSC